MWKECAMGIEGKTKVANEKKKKKIHWHISKEKELEQNTSEDKRSANTCKEDETNHRKAGVRRNLWRSSMLATDSPILQLKQIHLEQFAKYCI